MSKEEGYKSRAPFVIVLILAAILFTGIVGYFSINQWYESSLLPLNTAEVEGRPFVVVPGESSSEIAANLEDEEFIKSATAFIWYVDRNDIRESLKAGTYKLSASMPVEEIATIIAEGQVDTEFVTILPGSRLDQIEDSLVDYGFSKRAVKQALNDDYTNPILDYKPKSASLEGYVFPESFITTADTTPRFIIESTLDSFEDQLTPEIVIGIKAQGLTVHEGIILASIVQKESFRPEEQRKIAQVFIKRLNEGIPLGADPTFIYAAKTTGAAITVNIDSPYNTRLYAGLPPGPIGNFDINALKAVSNPTDTDFLYFVAGDDGITRFTKTQAEHEAAAEKHCNEACKLPN